VWIFKTDTYLWKAFNTAPHPIEKEAPENLNKALENP